LVASLAGETIFRLSVARRVSESLREANHSRNTVLIS
jgi:hypothetical protein